MGNSIITSEVVSRVLRRLETKTAFKKESISYEIQDDSNHLLISISIDSLLANEPASSFKNVGELVNLLIPGRRGDYSWMVVFTKGGFKHELQQRKTEVKRLRKLIYKAFLTYYCRLIFKTPDQMFCQSFNCIALCV